MCCFDIFFSASYLPHVISRMGLLAVLRSKQKQGTVLSLIVSNYISLLFETFTDVFVGDIISVILFGHF